MIRTVNPLNTSSFSASGLSCGLRPTNINIVSRITRSNSASTIDGRTATPASNSCSPCSSSWRSNLLSLDANKNVGLYASNHNATFVAPPTTSTSRLNEVHCPLRIGLDNEWIAADSKRDVSCPGIQIAGAIIGDEGRCSDDILNSQSDNVGAKRHNPT